MSLTVRETTDRLAWAKSEVEKLPAIDWSTVESARPVAAEILRRIGTDAELLTALLENSITDEYLRGKAEIHSLDDKIVLWDDQDKGHRIRLRLAHTQQYERVHNHRFSFAARILHGRYEQNLYSFRGTSLDETAQVNDFKLVSSRFEEKDATICIDHDQLHTTLTPPQTISLMIQSPAKKRRAFIIRKDDGEVWWRVGEKDESPERRKEVHMDDDRLHYWTTKLREFAVINQADAEN